MSQVTCPDHSECMNTVGSYECQCLTGFVKNSTGLCAECPEGTHGTNCSSYCACNSTNVASCDHVNGMCSCKAGWEHVTCDDDIDECNTSRVTCPAQSECVNTAGSYACLCLTGFVKNSTGLCAECDKDTYGTSCSEQCNCTLNAESCSHVDGACVCKTGWNGSRCENDVNECLTNQSSCPGDHMICVNEFGGFNCTCEEGYTKNGSNSCIDVDECLNERDNGCKQECSNTIGSYLCSCSPGFVGSGNDCRELTRIGMTVEMQITAPKAISDNTSETYKEWKYMAKNALYKKLKPQVPGLQAVIIKSLRLGSLVIDYDAAIDNETHPDAATDLTVAVMDLAKGQLTIDNQTANVSLTMNEMKVDTTTLACDVFKTVTPCPAKQECQIKDGAPGCQALTPDSGDQRPLYIAGVVGGLFVLATVLVVIVTLSLRRRRASTKKASAKDNGRDTVPAERTFTSISGKLQRSSSDRAASVASGSSLPSSRRMWRPYSP
ncbi:hypothetical protein V1264_008367 [Littorina saxatilis]|uniref:EGF-like domain-containing protein n=2 Tax=Littorina saxatilis TaxID=31220 RepID=A0AAN9ATD5_9CAEN